MIFFPRSFGIEHNFLTLNDYFCGRPDELFFRDPVRRRQTYQFFGITSLEAHSATISKPRSKIRVPRVSRPLGPKLITISTLALFSSVPLFIWFLYSQVYFFSETSTLREVIYLLPFFTRILIFMLGHGTVSSVCILPKTAYIFFSCWVCFSDHFSTYASDSRAWAKVYFPHPWSLSSKETL